MLRFEEKCVMWITKFRFSLSFLPSLGCISKAMHSFRAYPAVKFGGSFSLPGRLTGCQTLQAVYWWGDKHWPTLIKLLVWLFPILYYNSIHTHTHKMHILIKASLSLLHILVTTSLAQRHRVLQEEVSSSGCGLILFPSACPLIVKQAERDSASWQQIKVKGLSCGGRHCVSSFLGLSVWFGSLKKLAGQSRFGHG